MVYQTRHISGKATLLVIAAVVAIFVSDFLFITLAGTRGIVTVALLLLPVVVSPYLLKYFRQKIEVETRSDRILIRYLNKPFCDHVTDREIQVNDIESYDLSEGSRGKYFTLRLKDGSEFNSTISAFGPTKEFDDMTADIISLIGKMNTVLGKQQPER